MSDVEDEKSEPDIIVLPLEEATQKIDQAVDRSKMERLKTKKDYIMAIKKLTDKI